MEVENYVRPVGDKQPPFVIDSGLLERRQLVHQASKVHDHTVSDDTLDILVENTGGNQMKLVFYTFNDDSVSSIGSASDSSAIIVIGRQDIHELALSLVSPLSTQNHVNATSRSKCFVNVIQSFRLLE